MHPLLKRQLKKAGLDNGHAPTAAQWAALVERVAETYGQADQDRYMLERSLSVCSEEMTELYEDLHRRSEDALARRAKELEESLALATSIQESVMHGILFVDKNGVVMSMNRRFRDMMRIPPELAAPNTRFEPLVEHCLSLTADPNAMRASQIAQMRNDPAVHVSADLLLADGRVIDRYTGPVMMKDGSVQGRIWSIRDVTEERKLAAQRLVVAERMAAVGQLVASVAHEINNPLAAILGNIEIIGERLTEQAQESELASALSDARDGLERIRVIARDLRLLSRSDEEKREPVDVNAAIESALQTAGNQLRHRARVVRALSSVPPVQANKARLHQVFLNLLVNAAQAIPDGRANDHEVIVSTEVDASGNVRATVRDTGAGIAPENVERVFDAFFSTKPIGVGTGLGLAIVKGIVDGFGGKIHVESQLGKGTAITIELLPAAPVEAAETRAPVEAPSAGGSPKFILAVDDEPLSRRWLTRALGKEHQLVAVASVDEAVKALATCEFDVILCDVMMPNRTGRDLYLHVEQTAPHMLERFVFMTGGTFADSLTQFLESVPVPTLDKPMKLADLRALIRNIAPTHRSGR